MLVELGPRVMHALRAENAGIAKYRVLAICLRYYAMFERKE